MYYKLLNFNSILDKNNYLTTTVKINGTEKEFIIDTGSPLSKMPADNTEIDRILEYCTPAWLGDIIVVTRGDRKDHEKKLFKVLKKLENACYRASEKKSEFFLNKMKWLGHEIVENGIKPNKEEVKAILDLKHPENPKQLKLFLGEKQYLAKLLPRLSERTDKLRKLLKKNTNGNGKRKNKMILKRLRKC